MPCISIRLRCQNQYRLVSLLQNCQNNTESSLVSSRISCMGREGDRNVLLYHQFIFISHRQVIISGINRTHLRVTHDHSYVAADLPKCC